MTTRLPLRRFSLRKIVYPESLHILIRLFYLEGLDMDANCYFCSVALVSTIVRVDTAKSYSLRRFTEAAHVHMAQVNKSSGIFPPFNFNHRGSTLARFRSLLTDATMIHKDSR